MAAPTEETQHILEAAFNEAFSAPSSRRQSAISTPQDSVPEDKPAGSIPQPIEPPSVPTESTTAEGTVAEDTWKQEYEEQVKTWRAQSAKAREKAEKVREEWEAKRAAEREEAAKQKVVKTENTTEDFASPSHADAGDLVTDEPQVHVASSTISHPDTIDDSQKWEEVNSATTSSYPSMSFPDQSATPPLEDHDHHQKRTQSTSEPRTATLSVFDSSLSTPTRMKALASSLAINLLLPFVNGVMLGFGEIFAKNFVLGWLGWGVTATNVGISRRRFTSRL